MPPKECFEESTSIDMFTKFGIENIRQSNARGLSRKQRSMLELAIRQAESSEVSQRHGAVITRGGSVLAVGQNKWRNRDMVTVIDEFNEHLTVHAEIDALSRVKDARGTVIYIARVGKTGEERFSRPCDRCAKALIEAGVKQVVYTMG